MKGGIGRIGIVSVLRRAKVDLGTCMRGMQELEGEDSWQETCKRILGRGGEGGGKDEGSEGREEESEREGGRESVNE